MWYDIILQTIINYGKKHCIPFLSLTNVSRSYGKQNWNTYLGVTLV